MMPDAEKDLLNLQAYIVHNLGEDLSITALAKMTNIGKHTLQRDFKKRFGIPIHEFIIIERMREAKKLLCSTDLPVKTIAIDCGYKSIHGFLKTFKSHFKLTPETFRLQQSNCVKS